MKIGILIAVMAVVTYLIRALPITLFRKEIKSIFLKSFLYYIPYAVLGAMTFPAIFTSTGSYVASSFGLVAAVIIAFFDKGLMLTAMAAVTVAFISGYIF